MEPDWSERLKFLVPPLPHQRRDRYDSLGKLRTRTDGRRVHEETGYTIQTELPPAAGSRRRFLVRNEADDVVAIAHSLAYARVCLLDCLRRRAEKTAS